MGLFDRFKRVVKANINDLITKAEDPEKMLNQLIVDMNQQLIESKKSVASAIADEKRFERQMTEQRAQSTDWERKAMLALRAAQKEPERSAHYEALAREALGRKQECDNAVGQFDEQWKQQHESVEKLKVSLRGLQQKMEEAQRKKNLLIARAKRAEAQKRIQQQISGLADNSAFEAFERMAARVDQIEAEADAVKAIGEDSPHAQLDREFAALAADSDPRDAMLADLRRKLAIEDAGGTASDAGSDSRENEAGRTPPRRAAAADAAAGAAAMETDALMEELKRKLAAEG